MKQILKSPLSYALLGVKFYFKFFEWLTVNFHDESWKMIGIFLTFVYLAKLLSNR